MAIALGLKLKFGALTALISGVITTSLQAWHKFTASTWTGSNRLPDSSTGGTNTAALYTGRGLSFDGVNDVVTVGATGVTVKTVVFYAYPDTTTQAFMQLQSTGAVRIEISSGTLSATGFTSPTLYVNGAASSTVAATTWQQIAVTSATGVSASNLLLGQSNTTYYSGDMSNVKMFSTQLSGAQIAELYANPEQILPTGAVASDLVGWWTMSTGAISGTLFNGASNSNTGAVSGATRINALPSPVPQEYLKSLSKLTWFDGVDDKITFSALSSPTSVSVYGRIFLTSASSVNVLGPSGGGSSMYLRFSGTSLTFYMSGTSAAAVVYALGATYTNKIFSFAFRLATGDNKMYVNGNNTSSPTTTFSGLDGNIGTLMAQVASYTAGLVYEVAIYNTGLTNTQLQNLSDQTILPSDSSILSSCHVYYKNTGNTSNDWLDLSGNARNGTVVGTPANIYLSNGLTTGKDILGVTLQNTNNNNFLAVSDGYAPIADAASLDITSAITLEAWIKPFTVSSTQTIIGKNSAYALNVTSGAKLQFQRWSSTSSGTVSSSASITANTWTHVAATYDGTNTKIYINGSLDTNSTSISGAIDSTATDVLMGALTTSTQLFNGYIDSAKIYSDDLSAANVLNNYTTESPDYA